MKVYAVEPFCEYDNGIVVNFLAELFFELEDAISYANKAVLIMLEEHGAIAPFQVNIIPESLAKRADAKYIISCEDANAFTDNCVFLSVVVSEREVRNRYAEKEVFG